MWRVALVAGAWWSNYRHGSRPSYATWVITVLAANDMATTTLSTARVGIVFIFNLLLFLGSSRSS